MDEEEFEKAAGLDVEDKLPEILNSKDSVNTKHEKMVKIATEKIPRGQRKVGIKGLA